MNKTKRIFIIMGILSIVAIRVFACDMSFTITDSAGDSYDIVPGNPFDLERGETYSLLVNFTQDHGRCTVAAEDTVFLLDEERWQESGDGPAMQLLNDPIWEDASSMSHEVSFQFLAEQTGTWELEVIRKCDRKEGYDDYLVFTIQ